MWADSYYQDTDYTCEGCGEHFHHASEDGRSVEKGGLCTACAHDRYGDWDEFEDDRLPSLLREQAE